MEEETLNGDLPPAYCSLYRPDNCSDTRVLAIRCLQVAAASGIIAAVYRYGDLEYRLRGNTLYHWILGWCLVHFSTVINILYWKEAAKKTPYNFLLLLMITVSTAFILLTITIGFLKIGDEFFIAWIFYAVLTLALLLYTVLILGTSQEFRARDASLLTGGLSILMIAITAFIVSDSPFDIFPVIYLNLLLFVVCLHTVYRLQEITSGEYHRTLTPADFVSAALYSQIDLVRDFVNWPVYLMKNMNDSE